MRIEKNTVYTICCYCVLVQGGGCHGLFLDSHFFTIMWIQFFFHVSCFVWSDVNISAYINLYPI